MAARGARAAGRARGASRAHEHGRGRSPMTAPPRRVRAGAAAGGVDRRPKCAGRDPMGLGRCRPPAQIHCGSSRAFARHNRGWRTCSDVVRRFGSAARHTDRVRAGVDPVRQRLRREPVTARRQRHRFHPVRVHLERKMVAASQGGRARHDASSGPAGTGNSRHRAVGGASGGGSRSAIKLSPITASDPAETERAVTVLRGKRTAP